MRLESECIDTPRMGGREGGLASFSFLFFFFSSLPFVRERLVGKGGRESWVEMGV